MTTLLWLAGCAYWVASLQLVAGQRATSAANGESACVFPFMFNNEVFNTCVNWNGVDWCLDKDAQWLLCEAKGDSDGSDSDNGATATGDRSADTGMMGFSSGEVTNGFTDETEPKGSTMGVKDILESLQSKATGDSTGSGSSNSQGSGSTKDADSASGGGSTSGNGGAQNGDMADGASSKNNGGDMGMQAEGDAKPAGMSDDRADDADADSAGAPQAAEAAEEQGQGNGFGGGTAPRSGEFFTPGATGDVVINEALVKAAQRDDFVELYNKGSSAVNVAGWTLKDAVPGGGATFEIGAGPCNKPEFTSIAPGSFLLFVRDGECSFSFGLGSSDRITLQDAVGDLQDMVEWGENGVPDEVTLSRIPDGAAELKLGEPSPGRPNLLADNASTTGSITAAEAPAAAANAAGDAAGDAAGSSAGDGAGDSLGNAVGDTAGDGADDAAAAPASDTGNSAGACCARIRAAGFETNLPVAIVDTRGQVIVDEPKINGTLCTCSAGGSEDYDGLIGIEIRGSTSARDYAKKSWAVELRNEDGTDKDFPLLGMASESDYAFYGPEQDATLGMRNSLAMALSNNIGLWAPNTKFMEVFLIDDGSEELVPARHYWGVYVLMELIKRNNDRVDISKRDGSDLSGGYIWKHDNNNIDQGDKTVWTAMSQLYMIVTYPKKDEVTQEELDWLSQFLQEAESALLSPDFADPFGGYSKVLDVDSFVDYFLVTEITKNPDGYRGSTYMNKDRGSTLRMGPAWDYNEAFGICCGYPIEGYKTGGRSGPGISGGSAISTNGWRFNICSDADRCIVDPQDGVSQWYRRLWQDAAFRKRVAERWRMIRQAAVSDSAVTELLDGFTEQLQDAAVRNYERWLPEAKLLRNAEWARDVNTLKKWTLARLAWMDTELQRYESPAAGR